MSSILQGLQLNELSNKKLGDYKIAAGADATAADKEGNYKRGDKRMSGIGKATKKEFANDTKKVKEDKWNPLTGGDYPTDYTSGDTTPSPAKFQAMLDYHGNNMNVIRALDDLYRNAQSGSYYDSTVRADRYLATIEFPRTGKTEKRYAKTKREAYEYAKGYNGVVTSIEKIDTQEDTSDLITLPVMLGIKDHKKKWMLQFPSEAYAQKWEFKHKNVAKILWDEQHSLYSPEPEAKPETEKDQEDDEPGKYGYDTETGKPLKKGEKSSRPQQGTRPQQASRPQQYHTSQQVGYTKPSKYNKDDVTDVEVKEDDLSLNRAVDSKGRTQQQWMQAVKQKFPDAKIMQSKMIDGPCQALLADGRKLSWTKVQQSVAEGEQRVDSLVTDALKVMRGSDFQIDPVKAIKTVLGDREYNSRRGFYSFYVKQLMDMYGQEGIAEGSEFGANYAEQLAQKVFNVKPKLASEDDVLNIGHKVATQDLMSQVRANYLFARDQDFPSDFVSAYYYLQKRNLNEFAPVGGDDREPDEEEILRQLAKMWWLGTEQEMAKAQKTLAAMGWEIGQDESGDDDAGVFVIRAGDEHGDSYIAFNHSDLEELNEAYNNYQANRTGFSRGQRDDERHDLDTTTQVWGLKINGKVWSKAGKSVTFTSKEAALNTRNAILKNRPDLEIGLVTKGGMAEEKQRLDPSCWKGYKKQGTKMKGDTRVNNCVPVKESSIMQGVTQLDEGWKEKLGAAALAGSMALGSAGAQARVTPDGQGGFTGGLKPTATVTAPSDNKPAAEAPKGFSKEYLQKAADPNRTGRYMISVEKAQELLKQGQGQ